MHTMIIGIAGGTGSGKTTLTDHLAAHFGPAISVVHHDNYYKRQDVPFEVRCQQNYDHPDAFDTDLMVQQLKELKAGRTIRCPVYSYADHNRTDETVLIRPAPVIIVEGILIFHDPRLRQLMDIRIFVETLSLIHISEPTRKYADIVVLEGGHNLVALDLIMQRIAGHIAENPPEDAT